jgi:hypothetical protein
MRINHSASRGEVGKAIREFTSEHWSIGHEVASMSGTEVSSDSSGCKFGLRRVRGSAEGAVDDTYSLGWRCQRQRQGPIRSWRTRLGEVGGLKLAL